MTNIFQNLWELAVGMIEMIGSAWNWLNADLVIDIPLKIPYLLPNGIEWSFGFPPIWLLSGGLVVLVVYWVVLK